ncbi:hypothetical protein BPMI_01536 [Candidatus Burkholderia pumila]|uniref:KAP NTPase domain-containing protein n=1 Tax=Candidatus Burkholderia pumila TaxID=1090375 RepID=A0ABR5HLB8_9BURK|nr:hypothetical protein BPMI_01536 [Candidatus Burkholderia pumila]
MLSELSLREGRVFAIRGGWGFGKSALKNLITERLDAKFFSTFSCVMLKSWQSLKICTIRVQYDQIISPARLGSESNAVPSSCCRILEAVPRPMSFQRNHSEQSANSSI